MKYLSWILLTLTIVRPGFVLAETLSLESYLKQVREKNGAFRGSYLTSEGAEQRSVEGKLLVLPSAFSEVSFYSDQKENTNPTFAGTKTEVHSYSLGISEMTPFGMKAKAYYLLSSTKIIGASSTFLPQSQYSEGKPVIEVTQSLWGNGFGRGIRAQVDAKEASALGDSYSERYKSKTEEFLAETRYWRLVAARQLVAVSKDTLDTVQKFRDWTERRLRSGLGDRSDLLQSEAALMIRKNEYQNALDEENVSARLFNQSREVSGESVPEELEMPTPDRVLTMSLPVRSGYRDDVKAAEQFSRAKRAQAQLGVEQELPVLEAFVSYAWNGRATTMNQAYSNSFKSDHPTSLVGVRLSVPLDFGGTSSARQGWRNEMDGADLLFQRKLYEQEQEWSSLATQLKDAQARLKRAQELEKAQKEKIQYERGRLLRGRSTTYQVLLFEQDYAQAEVLRIRTQLETLQLISQMKLYTGSHQ